MKMNMNMDKKQRTNLQVQRCKTGLSFDKAHVRKEGKRVDDSRLPSDMRRIEKPLLLVTNRPPP